MSRLVPTTLDPDSSQAIFRAFLAALARPGSIVPLGLSRVKASVGDLAPPLLLPLALADVTTDVAVIEDSDTDWASFLVSSGSGRLVEPQQAELVAAVRPPSPDELRSLRIGSAVAPQRGAKVAIGCDGFESGPVVRLTGPGVPESVNLSVAGLDVEVFETLAGVNSQFPAGIDTWFVSDRWVAAIPRSVRIDVIFEEQAWATPR